MNTKPVSGEAVPGWGKEAGSSRGSGGFARKNLRCTHLSAKVRAQRSLHRPSFTPLPRALQPPVAARDPAFVPAQAGFSPPPSAHSGSGPTIGHTRSLA